MADVQESFTERILRRASMRRHRDSNSHLNSSKEVLQRKYQILRAIKEPSPRGKSYIGINDNHEFNQSYDFHRDSFNLTGISCNNNNDINSTDAYKNIGKDDESQSENVNNCGLLNKEVCTKTINLAQTDDYSLDKSLIDKDNSEEKPTELPKIMEDNITSPPMVITELNVSEKKNSDGNFDINLIQVTESLKPLTLAAIEDPDSVTDIQNLRTKNNITTEAIIEMCNKVYTTFNNCESLELRDVGIKEVDSTRNSKNVDDDTIISEKIFKSEMETSTLKSIGNLIQSNPRKNLFPTASHAVSANEAIIVPVTLNQKYEDSEEPVEIGSTLNDTTTYDEEKFLADALGDELYKMSETYDEPHAEDKTCSDFNASDLISEDDFPLQRSTRQTFNLPTSKLSSPRSSSTLKRSMGIYRSLSQRIKKKFRSSLETKKALQIAPIISSKSKEIQMMQDLLRVVKVQQTLMDEAAEALRLYDTKKELLRSLERIESERLLLLASLRRRAALEKIKSITSDEDSMENTMYCEKAEVTVSNINLDLRECLRPALQDGDSHEYFVVTVTQELNVWGTPPIPCPINESSIRFPESISLPDLTPGFKIVIEVYSLRIQRADCNENKSRISKQSRSTSCLPYSKILVSPTKLFKKIESPVSPILQEHNKAWKSRHSSFVLSGFTELFLRDLSSSSMWLLSLVPTNSKLKGSIDLNLACRLHLATSHEGFLNFHEEMGGFSTWNRRWCVLKGHTLMFWNYPREQDVNEPVKIIELMTCVSNEITLVDRTICSKPRTLLIETERSRLAGDRNSIVVECTSTSTFVRNLLSYDSLQELNEWSEKLNQVLLALEKWHIIGQRTQVSEL